MKRYAQLIRFLIIILFVCGLIANYKSVSNEILASATMWAKVLVPSLFPYLVISRYLIQSGLPPQLNFIKKIISRIFNISLRSADVFICSLFCGYPCGAVCCGDLYNDGQIDKKEAQRLVCFTNNSGPLFLICAVGGSMFSSVRAGFLMYVIQTISACIIAIASGIKTKKDYIVTQSNKRKSKVPSFCRCCEDSVETMLYIGAYIITATALGETIVFFLSTVLPLFSDRIKTIVYFFLEISKGMSLISTKGLSHLTFSLGCACAAWSGICVIMQIYACLPKELFTKRIIISKIIQGIISFLLAFFLGGFITDHGYKSPDFLLLLISPVISVIIFLVYIIRRKKI